MTTPSKPNPVSGVHMGPTYTTLDFVIFNLITVRYLYVSLNESLISKLQDMIKVTGNI